jgi:hypothetical protein
MRSAVMFRTPCNSKQKWFAGKMYSFTHHDGVEEEDNNVANKCPRAQHQK